MLRPARTCKDKRGGLVAIGTAKKGGGTIRTVWELVKPVTDKLGLMLWDIRFEKEGAAWYLRILIDKEGGVGLDDCEAVHRPVDKLLDEADPIEQSYVLEICSPGLGRDLRRPEHFAFALGQPVRLRLIHGKDGVRDFAGLLTAYGQDGVILADGSGEHRFSMTECAYIRLNDDDELF